MHRFLITSRRRIRCARVQIHFAKRLLHVLTRYTFTADSQEGFPKLVDHRQFTYDRELAQPINYRYFSLKSFHSGEMNTAAALQLTKIKLMKNFALSNTVAFLKLTTTARWYGQSNSTQQVWLERQRFWINLTES